jgi:hypothetical protein
MFEQIKQAGSTHLRHLLPATGIQRLLQSDELNWVGEFSFQGIGE